MLSPADTALADRDPALPGLAVVLDADRLSALLGGPVSRQYLRYKPATSCVLAARTSTGDDVVVTAYTGAGRVKADKTLLAQPDAVLLHDEARRLLVVRAAGDRDLPALRALGDPRRRRRALRQLLQGAAPTGAARLTTLAYKPHRRWVGLADVGGLALVLRAYPPGDAAAAAAAVRQLAAAGPRTPRLLGHLPELGLLALEHLPGRELAAALCAGDAGLPAVVAAGRALAALHLSDVPGLPAAPPQDVALRAAAAQLGVLLPELADRAARLADHLAQQLADLDQPGRPLHGDFSLDQVVLDGTQPGLIDLDRAHAGHPAADLAGAAATLAAGQCDGRDRAGILAALETGYAQVAPLPDPRARAVSTAVALLRRSAEPFRTRRPDWPDAVRALLAAAQDAARAASAVAVGPLDRSPADLLRPLLGGDVALQVLKDKPGRRCTSRAQGPAGTAIVKVYASARAPVVASRLDALAGGPAEPAVPRVLLCDPARHTVVLSEVPGEPFIDALLRSDVPAAERVGRALGTWHGAHRGRVPAGLRPHTAQREGALLLERAAAAPPPIAAAVRAAAPGLLSPWECDTVVHRDLYEEQVVLGELVGLIDLDDAAAGPAELDMGNLAAHLRLFTARTGAPTEQLLRALLTAYTAVSPLDPVLLARCEQLSLLRLACLHRDPALLPVRA